MTPASSGTVGDRDVTCEESPSRYIDVHRSLLGSPCTFMLEHITSYYQKETALVLCHLWPLIRTAVDGGCRPFFSSPGPRHLSGGPLVLSFSASQAPVMRRRGHTSAPMRWLGIPETASGGRRNRRAGGFSAGLGGGPRRTL